jgi:hypothetical protein
MANLGTQGRPPPERQSFWRGVLHQISGVALLGLIGTLIGAYFQNITAYQDKVAALAQQDMSAATQALDEIGTKLSTAISLQQRFVGNFYNAICLDVDNVYEDLYKETKTPCKNASQDSRAYLTKSAGDLYKSYMDNYASFHQGYNLLAEKAEIYLDWPSDPSHDAANDTEPSLDPINMSTLGAFNFDCEKDMPKFREETTIPLTNANGTKVTLDWNSAKHLVLTAQYCYEVTHQHLTAAFQWASQSTIDPVQWSYLTDKSHADLFKQTRGTNQILRFNAFMRRAMSEIEAIRVRFRPNGYECSIPIANALLERCAPVKLAK